MNTNSSRFPFETVTMSGEWLIVPALVAVALIVLVTVGGIPVNLSPSVGG